MMFLGVLRTELLKLRRTRVPWVLALVYGLAPLMSGLMMVVLKNPELGRRMGLVAVKAQITVGMADWPTYLMICGFLLVGGTIVLGIFVSFVFGREYADGTAKNMLVLPVGRAVFVAAKVAVSVGWFFCVAVAVYSEALILGLLIELPGFSPELLAASIRLALRIMAGVVLVATVPAWMAVYWRGYLPPVGFTILFLLLGDLFAHTGWGPWIPWSIILMTAGAAGPEVAAPGAGSVVVLLAVFAGGFAATCITLDRADNAQ